MEPQIQKTSSVWFRVMRYFFFSASIVIYSLSFFQEIFFSMLFMFASMLASVVTESIVRKKHKKVIFIAAGFAIFEIAIIGIFHDQPVYKNNYSFRMILMLGVFIISLISPFIADVKQYSKIFMLALGLLIIGLLSKITHLPGASLIVTVSVYLMTIVFIVQWFYSFRFFKTNILLMLASLLCNFVVSLFYLAWLFRMQHWEGAALLSLDNYFAPLFGIVSAFLIIGVQMNDFTSWLESQRKYLVNNLLIPWFVVFLIGGWMLLFQQSFSNLMTGAIFTTNQPFGMQDYSIDAIPK